MTVAVWLAAAVLAAPPPVDVQPSALACSEWRDCRQQTLDALERGEHERAHDLAWRTVQAGPAGDADLMYLLARAQGLAGRPQDALVMLRRLAERGVATEAATDPDFARTRALPGWAEVEALMAGRTAESADTSAPASASSTVTAPAAPPDISRTAEPPAAAPASTEARASVPPPAITPEASPAREPAVLPRQPAELQDAIRFSTDAFVAGGLAYDAVSRRFLFGDRMGRKLRVVGEGLEHDVDLVGAASAGFLAVQAIEIDARRGDLWVASADAGSGEAALHKLQLISGRLLQIFPAPAALTPAAPIDLAVSPAGAVFALDADGGRILRIRRDGSRLESAMDVAVPRAASLSMGRAEGILYVAHADGILRVDVERRTAAAVTAPKDVSLGGFERIRLHDGAIAGIQVDAQGERRVVRLELAPNGRIVRKATVYDAPIPGETGPTFVTVVGDDLCFVSGAFSASGPSTGVASDLIVHRVRLR